MPEAAFPVTEDAFLAGKLRLRQPASGHRAGHDAILLAAATRARPGERLADFGAGVGAAGLAVATRLRDLALVLVEIDPELAALASTNLAANGMRGEVVRLDLAADAAAFADVGLGPDSLDGVLMNPPFNHPVRQQASPNPDRRSAHAATRSTLDVWVHAARRTIKPGGALTLIWRADGLAEIVTALTRGFGSLAILPVHGRDGETAIRVVVRAIKGGRAPLQLYSGFMLNDSAGVPTEQAKAVLAGEAILPLGCA
ncbi:MAG TPA: methyltransferase [Xanthobacteraceae bacterium]|nr:methyltransferase [Xanthobacteraceae bacterium]